MGLLGHNTDDAAMPVGRAPVLEALVSFAGGPRPVAFIHGPGGIGKTTVLAALAAQLQAASRPVCQIDLRDGEVAIAALNEALTSARGQPGSVLLLDTFEHAEAVGPLIRDGLAAGVHVVLAGRTLPDERWDDPVVVALGPLDAGASRELVRGRGVTNLRDVQELVAWGGGSPLALSIVSDVVAAGGRPPDLTHLDADEVIGLVAGQGAGGRLLGADREVLAVAAIARATDARMLAAALPGVNGDQAEAWLRGLSFSQPLGTRVALHERVGDAMRARLRVDEPEHERALRRRIVDHLFPRAVLGELWLMRDLAALISDPELSWGIGPAAASRHRVDRVRAGDVDEIARSDGIAATAWRTPWRRWFAEAPDRVLVVRDAGGALTGYGTSLTPASAPAWAHEDPLAGPWLTDAATRAPDGNALMLRDSGYFDVPDGEPSEVVSIANFAVLLGCGLRSPRWLYVGLDRDRKGYAAQRTFLEAFGYRHLPEIDVVDEDRYVESWLVDFGPGGIVRWVRDLVYRDIGLPPPPVEQGGEVAAGVVRDALRGFHDPIALAASPLARGGGVTERAASVRQQLTDAVEVAFGQSADERLQRATIQRGYLDAEGGHQRAALELSLGRTTYFRRLASATDRLTDIVVSRQF